MNARMVQNIIDKVKYTNVYENGQYIEIGLGKDTFRFINTPSFRENVYVDETTEVLVVKTEDSSHWFDTNAITNIRISLNRKC